MPDGPITPGWRLPREGRVWLLVSLVLLTVGMIRNINLLALLGCILLAVLVIQALAVGRGLSRLNARRWADEVLRQGVPCRVEVRVANDSSRTARGVWVEDTGQPLGWYIDRVEGGGRYVCHGEVVPPRRGWFEFGPLLAGSGHPFGLVRRRIRLCDPLRVLVLPRPGRLSREQFRRHLRGGDPRGEHSRQTGARHELARADFHGLRQYRPGDSLRWIHWRTSARRGQLMVKEYEDVPGEDLVLVFDPTGPDGPAFERAVTLAATLAHEWCQRRGDRLIVAIAGPEAEVLDGTTGPEHGRRVMEALAVVAAHPAGQADLGEGLWGFVPRTASAVVVAAGASLLPGPLEEALGRSVTLLDASDPAGLPFYTPPEDAA